jgi:hypothetical protein
MSYTEAQKNAIFGVIGAKLAAQENIQTKAREWGITQSTFVPNGSRKIHGKNYSSVSDEVDEHVSRQLKKYGVNNDMRRYVKIMKDRNNHAANEAVQTEYGVRYTDSEGRLTYVDGDALNTIYANEKAIEDQINDMVEKCLQSDTCAHIVLGDNYQYLEGGSVALGCRELVMELNPGQRNTGPVSSDQAPVIFAEARPMYLRTMNPKGEPFSLGILKLRALVKVTSPILEYKSGLANDEIVQQSTVKLDTGVKNA